MKQPVDVHAFEGDLVQFSCRNNRTDNFPLWNISGVLHDRMDLVELDDRYSIDGDALQLYNVSINDNNTYQCVFLFTSAIARSHTATLTVLQGKCY